MKTGNTGLIRMGEGEVCLKTGVYGLFKFQNCNKMEKH
jgi:hypothetical protein